ncbi:unnamed protein product [Phytomonas sp. Hart1]|nr:unnamed protein product [Phytomonas sp. Hart1]|eukprot:CCW67943.1 unnamed protein product [Phytomonas sp. isolate Hart1]
MKVRNSTKNGPKNISVFLRVRPPTSNEEGHSFDNIAYDPTDGRVINVKRITSGNPIQKKYLFNCVFKPKTTQKEVYDVFAKNAVDAAFDGLHGVLFVYGQTGSGKTFTISNDDGKVENLGMLQRSLKDVWNRIALDKDHDYSCMLSYVQLHNEILTDILDKDQSRVRIQMGPEGAGDVILVKETTGLPIEKPVKNYEETMQLFELGMSRREIASTSMNQMSSRSHTILNFLINKSQRTKAVAVKNESELGEDSRPSCVALEGRLIFCDLAGSERLSKSHADGKNLVETTHINGSLLVLGKVVHALTEKLQHAPFRESKLTRILQYSLMGNGDTSIIVNVSPSNENTEESLSAIQFGQRAIQIKQDALRHEILDYKALYLQLMAELDAKNDKTLESALKEEREVYEYQISTLKDQLSMLTSENAMLRGENATLRSGLPPETLNDTLKSLGEKDWKEVMTKTREMIANRDEKIRTIDDERMKLALLFSIEQRKCFKLAQKMQATIERYQHACRELTIQVNKLHAELAAVKGTDYLSLNANSQESPASPGSINSEQNSFLDGTQEDFEKQNRKLQAYRAERIELIVYQSKAQKAIRMLVAENDALRRKYGVSKVRDSP